MSTLYTDNIRANNASQITVPTGQKIVGTDSGSIVAPGHVIQVAHTTYGTEFVYSGGSWSTFFSANFTPKLATSHIYIDVAINVGKRSVGEVQFNHRLQRNGTALTAAQHFNTTFASNYDVFRAPDTANAALHIYQNYSMIDDTHNTTSQITYALQVISPSTAYPDMYFNYAGRSASFMKFMEVAQ